MRGCYIRKVLKEPETEDTISFMSSFLSLLAVQLGGEDLHPGLPWLRLWFYDYLTSLLSHQL